MTIRSGKDKDESHQSLVALVALAAKRRPGDGLLLVSSRERDEGRAVNCLAQTQNRRGDPGASGVMGHRTPAALATFCRGHDKRSSSPCSPFKRLQLLPGVPHHLQSPPPGSLPKIVPSSLHSAWPHKASTYRTKAECQIKAAAFRLDGSVGCDHSGTTSSSAGQMELDCL